jgi:hypothetical protein
VTSTEVRKSAAWGLGWMAGGIAGAKLWRAHPVLGFLVGSGLGGGAVTLVTGYNPLAMAVAARSEVRPA